MNTNLSTRHAIARIVSMHIAGSMLAYTLRHAGNGRMGVWVGGRLVFIIL